MQLLSVLLTAGVLSVTTVDALPRIVCQQNPDGSWNYPACAGRASGKVRRQQWSYREHTPVCMQLPNGSWNYSFCDFGGDANLSRLRCIQHPDGTWNYPECTTTVTDVFSPNDPWWNPLPYPGGPVPPSELDERSVEVEGLMRLPMEKQDYPVPIPAPEAPNTHDGATVVSSAPEPSTIDNTAAVADAVVVDASEITPLLSDVADTAASKIDALEVETADATALEAEAEALVWDIPSNTIVDEIIPSLLAKIGDTVVWEKRDPMARPSGLASMEKALPKVNEVVEDPEPTATETAAVGAQDANLEIVRVVTYVSDPDHPMTGDQLKAAVKAQEEREGVR